MKTNLKIWLVMLLFISSGRVSGLDRWQKTFGGRYNDFGYSVQQTTDGCFIIAGGTASFGAGGYDVYLIKTDSEWNMLWQRTFGGSDDDAGYSVQQTTDGCFIIAGETYSFGAGDPNVYLIKTDTQGKLLWQKTFGGSDSDYGESVHQTTDGGFIIAGWTTSFGARLGDVYLIKTDPNGNLSWQKTFGGRSWDYGHSVQQTTDGCFIIAGETYSFGAGDLNIYLIKTDTQGKLLWQKTFGGNNDDEGYAVQQTTDGGFVIAGKTTSFGAGESDVYLIKTDPNGNLSWQKTFGGRSWDYGHSVQQTTDGCFIIAGETYSFGAGSVDVYLIKTDTQGKLLWQKTFGGSDWDSGHSVQQTADGGFIIAGQTSSFGAGKSDVYLIKLGPPIIYVDDDANGLNNGSSWEDAYNYLQDALADANSSGKPVEIRVAQGTYRPDEDTGHPAGTGSRTAAFQLINGVTIKGGYAGPRMSLSGADPNARNIKEYETILSGDLKGDDIEVSDPCDLLTEPTRVENSYHIFYHPEGLNLDATAILDGFAITGGKANGSWPNDWGGGMFNEGSSPLVSNCTFRGNSAEAVGGGMYNYYSSPTLEACTFSENSGGGIVNLYYSSPTVTNCTFTDNSGTRGGGMYNFDNSNPTVEGCTFSGNAATYGGGMYNDNSTPTVEGSTFTGNSVDYSGAGMCNDDSSPTVEGCTFSGNSAKYYGGGMYNYYSSPLVSNCTFRGNSAEAVGGGMCNYDYSSPRVEGCTFSGNSATDSGGGMYNSSSSPTINNCTFSGSLAGWAGGGMYNWGGSPTVTNCILWADAPSEIYGYYSTPIVTYSDVQGGWPGEGNIDAEPCFLREPNDAGDGWGDDPATPDVNEAANDDYGDLHLLPDSPCINDGNNTPPGGLPETDMDGEARVMWETVDMGADEFNPVRFVDPNRTRKSRTEFVYDCNVSFTNLWPFAIKNVQLEMLSVPDNMDINEPTVLFGDIDFSPRESITSIDTCTFKVDRSQAIDPAEIIWRMNCTRADTGMPIELTIGGVGSGGLESMMREQSDFEALVGLADNWLWVGPPAGIEEDTVPDGTVNLADFARLAQQWGTD